MSVLGWILFGFIVGLIARALMPGRDPLGLIGTIVLGIVGALAAGWIGQALGFYGPGNGAGFVAATLGAVLVLAIYYGSPYAGYGGRGRRGPGNRPGRMGHDGGVSPDNGSQTSSSQASRSDNRAA